MGRFLTLFAVAALLSTPVFSQDEPVPETDQPLPGVVEGPFLPDVPVPAGAVPVPFEVLPAEFAVSRQVARPAWYFQTEVLALKRDGDTPRTFAVLTERDWSQTSVVSSQTEITTETVTEEPDGTKTTETTTETTSETMPVWAFEDTSTTVLTARDLGLNFQGGGRVLIGRTLDDYCAVEAVYFDVADWDGSAHVADSTDFATAVGDDGVPIDEATFPASLFSLFSDFGNPPMVGYDYDNLIAISSSSRFGGNIELNLRRWILTGPNQLQVSVLAGARYMTIDESFFCHAESPVEDEKDDGSPYYGRAVNQVSVGASNMLVGGQVGALFKFHADRNWWIDCEVKGAVFDNDAAEDTDFRELRVRDGKDIKYPHTGSGHVAAFALDLNLTATWLVSPRLAVRGGYQALWVDGLAVASDFPADVDVLTGGGDIFTHNGKLVFHGPHLGVTWIW